jgi:aspartyl-tRNA(Asn)/glutamyl-tRNA(Gln) amidotransferase subunit A
MVPLASGSDAGGSIRIPAAFSGCFGIKPTFGLVPTGTQGILGWNDLSHQGPLSRTVADAALYLDVVAGYHPADPNSRPRPSLLLRALDEPLPPLRALFVPTLGLENIDPDIATAVRVAVAAFANIGHEVVEEDRKVEGIFEAWMTLTRLQSLAAMRQVLTEKPNDISATYRSFVDVTTEVSPEELRDAYAVRTRLNRWLQAVFGEYDLLLTPTMPLEAFAADGPIPLDSSGDRLGGWVITFTAPFNLSGHPAASVPVGFTSNALPVGLQIVAERHRDDLVLQAARAMEEAHPWPRWQVPDI